MSEGSRVIHSIQANEQRTLKSIHLTTILLFRLVNFKESKSACSELFPDDAFSHRRLPTFPLGVVVVKHWRESTSSLCRFVVVDCCIFLLIIEPLAQQHRTGRQHRTLFTIWILLCYFFTTRERKTFTFLLYISKRRRETRILAIGACKVEEKKMEKINMIEVDFEM